MPYFVPKIGHLDPRFYSLIYCAIPGVQMSGVQMSDFISKIGHLDPRFYSLIYCDTGGPDVGGPDVGGPDVGGPDVRGPDVRGPDVRQNCRAFLGFLSSIILAIGVNCVLNCLNVDILKFAPKIIKIILFKFEASSRQLLLNETWC